MRRSLRPTAFGWALIVVTVAAVAVRVGWCAIAVRPHVGEHDPAAYVRLASSLASGHGYTTAAGATTAYYPVGYPAALAVAWWIVTHTPLRDDPWWTAAGLNIAAAAAAVALTGVLARRITGSTAGIVAASLVALHPNLVLNAAPALTESTFTALALGGLVLAGAGAGARQSRAAVVAAGALLGLAGLVRPVGLVLVAVVSVGYAWARRPWRARLAPVGLLVTGALAVTLPWAIRNEVRMDRATLATSTGDNLCIGNHPDATGAFALPPWCFADVPALDGGRAEATRDRTHTSRALRWAIGHLAEQPRLVWQRTFWTLRSDHDGLRAVQSYEQDPWLHDGHPRVERAIRVIADAWWWVLVLAAVVGALRWLRSRRPGRGIVVGAIVGLLIAVWPFFGDTRFHLPIVPLLAVPAADALVTAAARVQRHQRDRGERGAMGGGERLGPAVAGDGPRDDLTQRDVGADRGDDRRAERADCDG